MTREELKAHCERQIKECEMWAKHSGKDPGGKIYEEHKLILELLQNEPCKDMGRAEQVSCLNMREETPEEQKAVEKYLKKISKPTGENFWDSVDESCKDMGRYDPYTDSFVNDDCISRQAAIKSIWDGTNMDIYTSEVKEKLEGLPLVQPKAKTEWIPIKTRPLTEKEKAEMDTEASYMFDCPLPDDDEEVEITTHWGNVTMDIFCRESNGCYFENYCDDGDVLAWRHKPEPYKAESEDKE